MRMPGAPVCSKAYLHSRYSVFARPVSAARKRTARREPGAMCGSTQWPCDGFPIIDPSRRPAARRAARPSASNAIDERGPYLKIAIVRGGQVVHRGSGCARSAAARRPTSTASSISSRRARPSFGHRCSDAPANTRILATTRCPPRSSCMRTCTGTAPVAWAGRPRSCGRVTRGCHAALRERTDQTDQTRQTDDTIGVAAIGDALPRRGIRDRRGRYRAPTPRPGAIWPSTSLRCCNERARFAGVRCVVAVSRGTRDYRRMKHAARDFGAIQAKIMGNEMHQSCRKVVFGTD